MKNFIRIIPILIFALLIGCEKNQTPVNHLQAVDVEEGQACHLCGMYVTRFAGPKGQSYLRRQKTPSHFCSTRDLFAYLLQPDVVPNIAAVFVHDMSKTDWDNPQHTAAVYTDARSAFYVIGHGLKGAMGHTIASFSDMPSSEAFKQRYGGQILRYSDITLETLNQLN